METRKKHIKKCGKCEKQVIWEHGSKPALCPHCNAIMWYKPKDECILFNLQEEFKKNRDERILGQMYLKMLPYTRRIITKMLGRTIRFDEDKFEEKVEDATTTLIHYFLRREDFYITESFGFQLLKAAQQQLYRKKQKDIDQREVSYDTPIKDGEENTFESKITEDSLEDGNKYSRELINISNKVFLVQEVSKFIDQIYNAIAKNRGIDEAILSMLLLHHFLNSKKEKFFDDFYSAFGKNLKESFELEKIVLLNYLKELTNDK
jgi:DNA-directed RNA polymerase subunit RPC12/RpoP